MEKDKLTLLAIEAQKTGHIMELYEKVKEYYVCWLINNYSVYAKRNIDDLTQELFLAFFTTLPNYSPQKGSYTSYVKYNVFILATSTFFCKLNGFSSYYKNKGIKPMVKDIKDNYIATDEYIEEKIDREIIINQIKKKLTPKEFSILIQKMNGDSYRQIAKKENKSTEYARQKFNLIIKKLKLDGI